MVSKEEVVLPTATWVDILYLTELRFPGGSSSSLVEEALAATAAGYRVGVLQCASSSIKADRSFQSGVQSLVDDGTLLLIRPGEPVDCSVVVVKHPTVMVESLGGRLPIRAESGVVFVGQVPVDEDGTRYYRPADVHQNIVEALGLEPEWHPVSPMVRRRLEGEGVPLAEADWVEVIDVDRWASGRSGPIGNRPVIGRHGRPSALKWPATEADLLAAYPDSDEVVVRVLGGTDGLEAVVTEVPASWEVHEFGSMDPVAFLAGIDFFVYFHHPDQVEAFGRTVIEALASGCVVVLPELFRGLFGEACLYAEPSGVRELVTGLHADATAFCEQSDAGLEAVRRRFSHATHVERLRSIAGPPVERTSERAAPTGRQPPGLRHQRPVVLVSCVGASAMAVARVLDDLAGQRDRRTGFLPVVLATAEAPRIAESLGQFLHLDVRRRCFVAERSGIVVELMVGRDEHEGDGRWEDHVLVRLSEVIRRHGVTSVAVADLGHPDAWLSLQASP